MKALPVRSRVAGRHWARGLAVLALVCALPAVAAAQGAATLYERTLEREQTARASGTATVESIRAIARSYEAIVRRYPASAYCDNALWQAAGLLKLAFTKSGDAADRQSAERLLVWLRREYPSSSLVTGAEAQLAELAAAAPIPTPAGEPASGATPQQTPVATPPPATAPSSPVSTAPPLNVAASSPAQAQAQATAPPTPASFPKASSAVIQSITQTPLPRGERLTIELSREVVYAGERVDGPDRVFVDFTNATAASALAQRAQKLTGSLIKAVRIGRHSSGTTRVVLELAGSPRYSTFPLYHPFRLVVDVEGDTATEPPRAQALPVSPPKADLPKAEAVLVAPPPRAAEPPAPKPAETSAAPPATPSAPRPIPPAITSRGDYSLARQLGLSASRGSSSMRGTAGTTRGPRPMASTKPTSCSTSRSGSRSC